MKNLIRGWILVLAAAPSAARAQPAEPEPAPAPEVAPAPEPAPEDDPGVLDGGIFQTRLYGYIDAQYRRPLGTPAHNEALEAETSEEHEAGFDLNLTLMLQGTIVHRYRYFLNIAAPRAGNITEDQSLDVRNAWVEAPLWGDYVNLRVGKTYRRFGLYNEILDAVPTFMGIEAPEMLVVGHLLTTRTTNLMLHGSAGEGDHLLQYALFTGNDEQAEGVVPLGADVRYDWGGMLLVGTSLYWTGGDAVPSRGVDPANPEGPPTGGVINWMDHDRYTVFGGYAQLTMEGLILQAEYWRAPHHAVRDPDAMLLLADTPLNERQQARFFNTDFPSDESDVNLDADYTVQTFWLRVGWEFELRRWGAITPYLHFELLEHPEAIANEGLGGNEAGLSDDGRFYRAAAGFVYRPIAAVALKGEYNPHFQTQDDETRIFHELRASLSYFWELAE